LSRTIYILIFIQDNGGDLHFSFKVDETFRPDQEN